MAADDADRRSKGQTGGAPPASPSLPRAPSGRGKKGLVLAPSDPELDDPPSMRSIDDLLGTTDTLDAAPVSEDNEPVALHRGTMTRSAFPPPLPPRKSVPHPEPTPGRTSAPPLRAALPPVSSPPPPLPLPLPPPLPPPHAHAPPHAKGPSKLPPPPRVRGSTVPPPLPRSATRGPALELLNARIASLESEGDRVALGRALAELAVMQELTEDDALATTTAQAALATDPALPAMHALLRRKEHSPGAALALLAHLREEIAHAAEGPQRTSLLAERARLLGALDRTGEALTAWSYVLAHDPRHPAALRGKEATLALAEAPRAAAWEVQASHFGAMAEAYADDPRTAAWLEVERAALLEARIGDTEAARGALTKALALEPGVGPVRRAMVRHVAKHRDAAALVDLLDEEGHLELDSARAARLELEAASIAEGALRDASRAILLLERAARRAPTTTSVDLRVLDDLTRLLDATGQGGEASRWRRARLSLVVGKANRAEELRALARAAEQAGDVDAAIADLEASLEEEVDAATVTHLDHLLASAGRHDPRIQLWVTDAARATLADKRVESLLRAAHIAERTLGRTDEAVRHLRTAWTTKPGHPEVLEALTRLLTRPTRDAEARPRLELYAHAAAVTDDRARKIIYLEKVALLAEETLGDPKRAAATYDEILALEPGHVAAILGLVRTAERARDDRAVHRGLLAHARISPRESDALALRTRAAAAIAEGDPAAAIAGAIDVLKADASHAAARTLLTRLYEECGQWELAAGSLEAHLAYVTPEERRALLLRLADIQAVRLKAPASALATLLRARESYADDARVLAAIARALESVGEPKAMREAYEHLASGALDEADRARFLVRAAELSEHRLDDDVAALRSYEDALLAAPGDAMIQDRIERVRARAKDDSPQDPLDHALALVSRGDDDARALTLLETALGRPGDPIPALRLLERVHRGNKAWDSLADVLTREADAFHAARPKLGALWALAELQEWRLEAKPSPATYARILALSPDDPEALAATVRLRLPDAIAGKRDARLAVLDALRRQAPHDGATTRGLTELAIAHLLDREDAEDSEAILALEHYRLVLAKDPRSVTAAWGMRRLAYRLGQTAAAVEASTTLAELTLDPKARGRHFFEAADLVANSLPSSSSDARDAELGDDDARKQRTATLLEHALEADPNAIASAAALTTLRLARDEPDQLLRALRPALERAKEKDAVIFLGGEVARVAREELHDLGIATLAMQRVRDVAPGHAPSLLTLAELYLAQRAWPEAVTALESVVKYAHDAEPRLTALFALGSIYDKVLARPDEHERVLRAALAIEPSNPRALRALIDQLKAARAAQASMPGATLPPPHELRLLLHRLAEAETDPRSQCGVYLDVADIEAELGDLITAEQSLVLAVVKHPDNARAFARLAAFFRRGGQLDAAAYANALQGLIARGREAGHADARWFAALGQLEVDTLQRLHDGIAHLEWAVQLDSSLHETRFELADAYARTGAKEQAIKTLLGLLIPDARPLAALADAGVALALLDSLLEQEKQGEEAVVVSELRATLGELDPAREEWLRGRKLAPLDEQHTPLGRVALVEHVLPRPGRHALLEVAVAATGIDAKLLRANLADLGVHSRDRIGPRSGHALRPVFDRVMAALGVEEVELAVSATVDRVRVVAQDTPWVVAPASLEAQPEAVQVAALARACARVLLGVPWLKELRDNAILGWLVAVARQVVPAYGAEDREAMTPDVLTYEPLVARAIGRKQRKLLEGLAPHLQQREGRPPEWTGFLRALDQCTTRAAYLVSGDLAATARAIALEDGPLAAALARPGLPALNALLAHPLAGDVARFALTPEATAMRRALGAAWAR
jgi:hypothetical protein